MESHALVLSSGNYRQGCSARKLVMKATCPIDNVVHKFNKFKHLNTEQDMHSDNVARQVRQRHPNNSRPHSQSQGGRCVQPKSHSLGKTKTRNKLNGGGKMERISVCEWCFFA